MKLLKSIISPGWLGLRIHRSKSGLHEPGEGRRPRLLIDVSVIMRHDAQTGIQRVVRAICSELRDRHGEGFDVVPIYATSHRGYCYAPLDFLARPADFAFGELVRARAGDRFLGLDLSTHYLPRYRRQLQDWRAAGATVHLIVYDLLPLIRPDWFSRRTTAQFRRWFDVVAHEADQAICISRQVGRDLRDRLHLDGRPRCPDVTYLGMGGDIAASCPSIGVCDEVVRLLSRMQFRPAILLVGTVEPRKGYGPALAAFEHLWANSSGVAPDMVIVGKAGWKTDNLQRRIRSHPELGKRLHWLDNVSDEGLCRLYDASRGVLVPSLGEGFGLPLLEAVIHQRHVLARDLPVFREQALPNVTYFEDDRPEALAESIMKLVELGRTRPRLTPNLPTWRESVDNLLVGLGLTMAATEPVTESTCA